MDKTLSIVLIATVLTAYNNNDSHQSDLNQPTGPYENFIPVLSGDIPLDVPVPPAGILNEPVLTSRLFDIFHGNLVLYCLGLTIRYTAESP